MDKINTMSYSPQLVYFLDRMSGFSTNIFKLMPSGSDSSGPNSISRITLPSNALLNTRSFKLHFLASTVAASSVGGRLPADISTLIERVEISAGGVQLSQGTNFYNTLVNAKTALMGSRCDSVTGHSELVRANKFDGESIASGAGIDETYSGTGTPHVIDKWEGFLGTCEPKILDASILPDLVVSIYWASNSVLASAKQNTTSALFVAAPDAGAAAVYEIKNIHASIETIGLADSVYDNMVASMIASEGFIEIPFKQYFSFSNTHTGSSRFTVATQSLDRIWKERAKAQMIQPSTTAYKKGFDLAQEQLDSSLEESTRGWQIDRELSTKEGLVLTKENRIRVAYRGTDLKNIHDLATDAAAFAGVEQAAPQMRSSKAQIEAIQRRYNQLPDELLGYSKGGAHALAVGDEFKIPSTTFNPLIGRKQVLSTSEVPHTVIRTVEDFASTPLVFTQHKKNYTVKSLNPIRGRRSSVCYLARLVTPPAPFRHR